jgi:NAD(P)-dependent dehydrogenase (short-subunit alcohol dehydrogenase family)
MAIKRMGQPEDMVGACLFLLSDEAGLGDRADHRGRRGQTFRS